jgi:hypothetical protein
MKNNFYIYWNHLFIVAIPSATFKSTTTTITINLDFMFEMIIF